MKKEFFLEEWKNINFRLQIFRFTTLFLGITIMVLSFVIYRVSDQERVVIIPAHLKEKVIIEDNTANESYVRAMSYYLVDLIYNVTPHNMENKFEEFLQYVPTSSIQEITDDLNRRIESYGNTKISSSIIIEEVLTGKNNEVYIHGKSVRYVSGRLLGHEPIYIHLKYNLVHGGFEIEIFENIKSDDYRNVKHSLQRDADK
jgi:type IV conjugative transfer system protein TraE